MTDNERRDLWRGEEWRSIAISEEQPAFDPGSKRLLIVDDQKEIRDLADLVLGAEGYRTTLANDGYQAIARLTESPKPFDLMLLDINMPEQDGWETLRIVRSDADLRSLRVIMFSVKGEVRDKMLSLQEGADDYLCKPFEIDELIDKIRSQFVETAG